jgi:hypothetical protein
VGDGGRTTATFRSEPASTRPGSSAQSPASQRALCPPAHFLSAACSRSKAGPWYMIRSRGKRKGKASRPSEGETVGGMHVRGRARDRKEAEGWDERCRWRGAERRASQATKGIRRAPLLALVPAEERHVSQPPVEVQRDGQRLARSKRRSASINDKGRTWASRDAGRCRPGRAGQRARPRQRRPSQGRGSCRRPTRRSR